MATENSVWSGTPSQIINTGLFIVLTILAFTIFLAPICVIVILWNYLVVKNIKYELTSQRLKTHSGVLSKRIEEIELYRIKDTQFYQPLFLRLFGFGNVLLISSDALTPVVAIKAIPNAQVLREQIRNLVEECRDSKRVRNMELA